MRAAAGVKSCFNKRSELGKVADTSPWEGRGVTAGSILYFYSRLMNVHSEGKFSTEKSEMKEYTADERELLKKRFALPKKFFLQQAEQNDNVVKRRYDLCSAISTVKYRAQFSCSAFGTQKVLNFCVSSSFPPFG